MAVIKNIKQLLIVFNRVLNLGLPDVFYVFQSHSCLRQIMSVMRSLAYILRSERDRTTFFPLAMLMSEIMPCASLPGTPPLDAARQLIEGGMVAFIVDLLVYGPDNDCEEKKLDAYRSLCWYLVSWVGNLCFYPSVHPAVGEALRSIDKLLQKELLDRGVVQAHPDGHWTRSAFGMLRVAAIYNESLKEEGRPRICDSVICPVSSQRTRLRECSRCHSVVYCSKICQQVDWQRSHHEDCPHLQREYFERTASCTWIHASTRLYHLVVLQDHYRLSLYDSQLENARQKTHPLEPLADLVVTYDFVSFPFAVHHRQRPRLSNVREFLAAWSRMKEEGRLGEIGGRRLEDMVNQFLSNASIRLVAGLFRLNDHISLLNVCRVHSPGEIDDPERVTAIGGFSALVRPHLASQ